MKKLSLSAKAALGVAVAALAFAMLPACTAAEDDGAQPSADGGTDAAQPTGADIDVSSDTAEVFASVASVEGRTFPYIKDFGDGAGRLEDTVTLYFVDGGDIPYVALSEYMPLMSEAYAARGKEGVEFTIRQLEGGQEFYVSRTDGSASMLVNAEEDTLFFDNFNLFIHKPGVKGLVSVMDLSEPDEMDATEYIMRLAQASTPEEMQQITDEYKAAMQQTQNTLFKTNTGVFNRSGSSIKLDLSDYIIDIVSYEGECYIPLQTMSDLFMAEAYLKYVFNGETLFGAAYGTDLLSEKYLSEPANMSLEYARFNYNELRFLLGCMYGLAPEHGIDSFGNMLTQYSGLADGITSRIPEEFDEALAKLTLTFFDDGHSGFAAPSFGSSANPAVTAIANMTFYGPSSKALILAGNNFKTARLAAYPDGVPAYQEIGDTAFITFDSFLVTEDDLASYYTVPDDTDYSQVLVGAPVLSPTDVVKVDTIRLVIYAHKMIMREGSPIKNVVVDLTNNGGGNADAAVFLISWLCGKADIAIRDTFTGAQTLMSFHADVNLDNVYSYTGMENVTTDSLQQSDISVYCLTSPMSFSCGNLVPAACKMSRVVTTVGQTSGGGSCAVLPCTTASGAEFQISGPKQLSIVRNGSFYNIDEGIEPDIPLTKVESFYDRQALVELLRSVK